MKNTSKFIVLASFLSVIVFSIPLVSVRAQTIVDSGMFDIIKSRYSWNTDDYINFTGPMIDPGYSSPMRVLIDDTDPNYNWSKTAAENAWCSGSGTKSDPYVIENLYINAEGAGACLFIRYSTVPFIVRNCWFAYTGSNKFDCGVDIYHTFNGNITNNIMTYNRHCVFVTSYSGNMTITDNIMLGDHHTNGISNRAIELGASHNSTVRNNFVFNCTAGMGLYDTANNTIVRNFFEDTIFTASFPGAPIHIIDCDTSIIRDNMLSGSFALGAFSISEDNCEGNVIEGNGPTSTLPTDISKLQIQQTGPTHISLENSNYNYIRYNLLYRPGVGGIPSYDPFLIIGIVSLVSIMSILAINKRKK